MSEGYTVVKATGTQWDDQLVRLVMDRKKRSEDWSMSFRRKLPQWYDLWRGIHTGKFSPTKNDIHLPLIYSTIWSDVARKVATSFSQWPIVTMQGYGPNDAPNARKQEALVNAQLRDAEVIEKEIVTFLGADLYGTAISQTLWEHKEEIRTRTEFQALPLSGERVRQIMRDRVVTFDGPNHRNVDLLDFFGQPKFRKINGSMGMDWGIVRYYLDLDMCRFMASEAGGKVFNSAEVERLARDSASRAYDADSQKVSRSQFTSLQEMQDTYDRPVELIEMWGTVPSEFAGAFGGSTNVVVTVANSKYLFRAKDNPFSHRAKPFDKFSPTPDPHYFYAPGKAEIAAHMQVAANRFINHQLDGADLTVHPMWAYNRNKGINIRQLFAGPGRVFGVDGDPGDALVPIPINTQGLAIGGEMTQTLWRYLQMGIGIQEDTVMGGGGGADRQTAREFMGRRESAGTRLMLESVIYEATYLEPLCDKYTSMNGQFLTLPRTVRILGEAAATDPVTGDPIVNSRQDIGPGDLDSHYAARAMGSTLSVSAETAKANNLQMFQVLASANPQMAGSFNMVNFLRQMLIQQGYKNVNELIQKAPQVAESLGQQGMTAGQMPNDTAGLAAMMGGAAPSGPSSGVPQ